MINTDMRSYDYFTIGEVNAYGQPVIPVAGKETIKGKIKIAINTTSQSIQNNIRYKDCTYIGLTHAKVDDTYVIKYGNERLKVLYVNPKGKYNQVFLKNL